MEGTVCSLRMDGGYGFIRAPGQAKDIFFHANDLVDLTFDERLQEHRVQFEIGESAKGKKAVRVRPVD